MDSLFSCLLQDLLALLKNVESEIASTEQNLKDEMEKRKKYRVSPGCAKLSVKT